MYAVAHGRTKGIFKTYDTAKVQISGFSRNKYKGFNDRAAAEKYLAENEVHPPYEIDEMMASQGNISTLSRTEGMRGQETNVDTWLGAKRDFTSSPKTVATSTDRDQGHTGGSSTCIMNQGEAVSRSGFRWYYKDQNGAIHGPEETTALSALDLGEKIRSIYAIQI